MFPDQKFLDWKAMKAILGKKLMMTRVFDETGRQMPVTLVKFGKNVVNFIKTPEKDGYRAIQVAAGDKKSLNQPEKGILKTIDLKARSLYEVKTDKEWKIGDEITLAIFEEGEKVNVTGVGKGRGFSGTVKRHHFHLGPKTHGSDNYRRPGSIGATDAQRVFKGKRMAGRLGFQKSTLKNLEVIMLNKENGEMLIRGGIPGPRFCQVLVWSSKE